MVYPIVAKQLNAREGFTKTVTITSAQLLAINTTPVVVLAAPTNSNTALVLENVTASIAAGTAYASVNDLVLKYTNGSGTLLSTITAAGFLDQTAAKGFKAATVSGLLSTAATVVITCGTGNPTTGTSDVKLRIRYRVVTVPVF